MQADQHGFLTGGQPLGLSSSSGGGTMAPSALPFLGGIKRDTGAILSILRRHHPKVGPVAEVQRSTRQVDRLNSVQIGQMRGIAGGLQAVDALPPGGRRAMAAMRARDAQGRFISSASDKAAGQAVKAAEAVAQVVQKQAVDARIDSRSRNGKGQFAGGGGAGEAGGSHRVGASLAGAATRAALGATEGVAQLDPVLAAADEMRGIAAQVKDVASPLTTGVQRLFKGPAQAKEEKKQTTWLRKIMGLLTLSRKEQQASAEAQLRATKEIKGPAGEAGGIMAMLPMLAGLLPKLVGGLLPAWLTKFLPPAFQRGASGAARGAAAAGSSAAGSAAAGAARAGGSVLSKALGLGKGALKLLKSAPGIGALLTGILAWGDDAAIRDDQTLSPEEKRVKRAENASGAVGSLVGGAAGMMLGGPIGAAVGAWLGQKGGELLGKPMMELYDYFVGLHLGDKMTESWDDAVASVSDAFKSFSDWVNGLPGMETLKKIGGFLGDGISSAASTVKDFALQKGNKVLDWAGDRAAALARGAQDIGSQALDFIFKRSVATGSDYRQGNIAGLDEQHTRALVASTAATESSGGKLDAVNSAGYLGRYQAGAGWLADAGLIKGGTAAVRAAMKADGFTSEYKWGQAGGMTNFLKNAGNWTGGMDYSKYLSSADAQDAAFKANSDKSYERLLRSGVIKAGMDQDEIAGILKARHIAGEGGAAKAAAGISGPADANGTTALKYKNDLVAGNVFTKAFESAVTAGAQPAAVPNIPALNIPAAAAPAKVMPLPTVEVASDAGGQRLNARPAQSVVVQQQPAAPGQNVGDRGIAHVATGGIGWQPW